LHNPLISVVVPVYNVERYLSQCLQSIVSQTYDNLEILVVDDGSTDGSGNLCDQWASRDSRIRVFHQPNGGLSAARNTALDAMHGELVTMVDSDDVVATHSITTLLDLLQRHHADVAVGSWKHFKDDETIGDEKPGTTPVRESCFDTTHAINEILYQRTITNSSCSRLFNAALFNGLRYPVGKLYEDVAIVYPLMRRASTTATTSRIVYYYRQREGSILQRFTPRRADILDILEELEQQVQRENALLLPATRSRLLSASFNILLLNSSSPTPNQPLAQRCWQSIRRLRGGCLTDSHVRLKNKAGIMASYMGQQAFCALFGKNYKPSN